MWYMTSETVHFCGCVEQADGFWKGADSAWRKYSWGGEEGEWCSSVLNLQAIQAQTYVLVSAMVYGLWPDSQF